MWESLAIAASLLGYPAMLWLLVRCLADSAPPALLRRQPLDTGPAPPCLIEEIAREGPLRFGRSLCIHEALLELDARAARGDYPLRELNYVGE